MFYIRINSGKFSNCIEDNFPSDTILQLKNSINKKFGFPIHLQKLLFNGNQLSDNKKISDYEIKNNDNIQLELKLLEVNFFKDGIYEKWYVEEGTTIAQLQKRITGIIFGIIFLNNPNDIIKDGEIILLS